MSRKRANEILPTLGQHFGNANKILPAFLFKHFILNLYHSLFFFFFLTIKNSLTRKQVDSKSWPHFLFASLIYITVLTC